MAKDTLKCKTVAVRNVKLRVCHWGVDPSFPMITIEPITKGWSFNMRTVKAKEAQLFKRRRR